VIIHHAALTTFQRKQEEFTSAEKARHRVSLRLREDGPLCALGSHTCVEGVEPVFGRSVEGIG